MVGIASPHAYSAALSARGGSPQLLREIREIDRLTRSSHVIPLYTLTHLCTVAKVPYEAARDVIFNHRAHYSARKLKKHSGKGFRTIHAPSPHLKSLQLAILENCLPKRPTSDLSYAYEPRRNTLEAARRHIGAKTMIQLDLADFFGSISSTALYKTFVGFGYPKLLAFEMSLISSVGHEVTLRGPDEKGVVYELLKSGRLPQGASTSGKLSNLVCIGLDQLLGEVATAWGGIITRYADDITFSTGHAVSRSECNSILRDLKSAIHVSGFTMNERKTRVTRSGQEHRVLGLCVGQDSVWLNRNYKNSIRAHLYGLEKNGLADHGIHRGFSSDQEFMSFIWGHYAYCVYVDPDFGAEMRARLELAGVERV
ncbi:reverse transcriptase family protein [Pseudarthrobacter sp. NamE5]|uniref:reverse transcriptase family protein n=1 Tax=Pseudarthrobacter sp. NamE5 TaxID=2576839 RepID=UPI00110AB336|nr:reverse transcriptase family protein [Pseudarthrobacter sp. NamE5]TLM86002.1 RNA-directed DNA polymerase [Pseudarthrobacter sp. NamE5]